MGQNTSSQPRIVNAIKEWIPREKDHSVVINIKTQQQLQCHYVEIAMADLLREVTIYNARIQAIYPYICRVAYFSQAGGGEEGHPLGHRYFAVYTDYLQSIRENQWTVHRFIHVLEAIQTLTSFYGHFRLTEKMIRVNERGETRVWISESPAKNHRDFALATEEDAIAAVAGLAVRKNYEVANQLIGCRSISEAMHRLIRPRKTSSPYNNLSHRTIEGSFFRKDQQNIYKNVFHQKNEKTQEKDSKSPSLFNSAAKMPFKPLSHCMKAESTISGRSLSHHKRSNVKSHQEYQKNDKNMRSEYFLRGRPGSIEETSFDQFTKNPHQRFTYEPSNRFAATSNSSFSHLKCFNTPSTPIRGPSFPAANLSPQPDKDAVNRDITIINNNVSHVVNNITHNHSHAEHNNIWSQVKNQKTPEFLGGDKMKNDSQSPGQKKTRAPLFIQQRGKRDGENNQVFKQNIKSFYAKSQVLPNSKPFYTQGLNFNSTQTSANNGRSTQQSFKNAQASWSIHPKRKNEKLYTFCRTIQSKSPQKLFSSSFSPNSQIPFTPPAQSTQASNSFLFKQPNRTKTTEFNDANAKNSNNFTLFPSQNKSLAIHPEHSYHHQTEHSFESHELHDKSKGKTGNSQAIPEQPTENLPTTKSIAFNSANSGKSIEAQKGNLKKQLKMEFGSLLGTDSTQIQAKKEVKVGLETPPESYLKQKIQQKKMAFAELKKQALAVLTDLF